MPTHIDPLNLSYKYLPFLKITDQHRTYNGSIWVNLGIREENDNGIIFRMERYHGGSSYRGTANMHRPVVEGLTYMTMLFDDLPYDERDYGYPT
ncbi:MAG: hypothetical protein MN733_18495 [Nitrososphaera sp.]|nr:hypothetical protein [Nitrososphaera sp.]